MVVNQVTFVIGEDCSFGVVGKDNNKTNLIKVVEVLIKNLIIDVSFLDLKVPVKKDDDKVIKILTNKEVVLISEEVKIVDYEVDKDNYEIKDRENLDENLVKVVVQDGMVHIDVVVNINDKVENMDKNKSDDQVDIKR